MKDDGESGLNVQINPTAAVQWIAQYKDIKKTPNDLSVHHNHQL